MHRNRWTLLGAVLLAIAAISVLTAGAIMRDGETGNPVRAVALPTACENFVEVTTMFAEQGSTSALSMAGADVFNEDPEARVFEVLRTLLDSCDAQLTLRG